MKQLDNYISEKLYIGKGFKTDIIKVGMKIESDMELYELIDFITADASDNEITEFLKKYKNVGNAGAWVYNIKNYKLTPEGRKSLDEFGYIMILKYVKYTADYIMVYYNQKFFHPINEKLYIGKGFNYNKHIDVISNLIEEYMKHEFEFSTSDYKLTYVDDKGLKINDPENHVDDIYELRLYCRKMDLDRGSIAPDIAKSLTKIISKSLEVKSYDLSTREISFKFKDE